MSDSMPVLHVVRRWGPVGGMEKYVFELARAQARQGVDVIVVCETIESDSSGIQLVTVERARSKPRWMGMLQFRKRVAKVIREYRSNMPNLVVHSHERTVGHDVTTFHGPPMRSVMSRKKLWFLSPRIWAWLCMESQELLAPSVRAVVANSSAIRDELLKLYPPAANRLSACIGWPGVSASEVQVPSPDDGFVFVGREWQRKGLPLAIEAVEQFRFQQGANEKLHIVGVSADQIQGLISNRDWIVVHGWTSDWSGLGRCLIHPALTEPYGMVVSEAIAAGMQVLVSKESGVSSHYRLQGPSALDSADVWARALMSLLQDSNTQSIQALYSWDDLATDMISLYSALK